MNQTVKRHRHDLRAIARRAMMDRGLLPDFSPAVVAETAGLAVHDHTHSTALNRRFPDLVTQRLLKAALAGRSAPYGLDDLEELARHCTEQEDNANKGERQVRKSAGALLLESRIGERFEGMVTGAS